MRVFRILVALFLTLHASATFAQVCDDVELSDIAIRIASGDDAKSVLSANMTSGKAMRRFALGSRLEKAWLKERNARFGFPSRCGAVEVNDEKIVVVAIAGAKIRRDGSLLHINIQEHVFEPKVIINTRSGAEEMHLRVGMNRVEIKDDWIALQVIGSGKRGPRPLASLKLEKEENIWKGRSSHPEHDAADIRDFLHTQRGSSLRENRLLMREAEKHAQTVCKMGVAFHGAGDEDPKQRLARHGIVATEVGEVVARGKDRDAALNSFLASTSHRAVLQHRSFSDLGFGVARKSGTICVVILMSRYPRYIGH